jgi:hypothetical protein
VDLFEPTRRDTRKAWLSAIALCVVATFVAQPAIAQAVQNVRVKGAVKVKDSTGVNIESEGVGSGAGNTLGLLGAEGSGGAVATRVFAGGTGLMGTGDCDDNNAPPDRPNVVTVDAGADTIITAIIITGTDASVAVTAPDLNPLIGPGPVANFRADATTPNVFVGLGTGLTVSPSELVFTCTAIGGGAGEGDFVILGQ